MVYQRGKQGFWWYRFRFGGRIVHESAKSTSKTVARNAERQRRRELEETWNRIQRRTLPPTFERAASEWQASRVGVAERTASIAKYSLKHLQPVFGSRLLCDITPDDIAAYQAKRQREAAQGRTVNIEVTVLRQVLKANDLWQPLAGKVRMLKERKDIARALTPEEESKLLEAAAKADSACYTAVVLALNTAMRKDEIRLLQWRQVDWERRTVTVGKSKTEAGSGRLIPLNPPAYQALAHWAARIPESAPDHYVFPWREHRQVNPTRPVQSWRKAWRNALKKAGFLCRFHDLRHTCITKLAETPASDMTVMSIAGHVSRKMLEHYSHIRLEAKRQALEGIGCGKPSDLGVGVHQNDNQVQETENEPVRNLLN